jgi:hypothetical protein
MKVAAEIVEDGSVLRPRKTFASGSFEVEDLSNALRGLVRALIDVDQEQLGTAEPLRALVNALQAFDLIPIKEDCASHRITLAHAMQGSG